MVALDRKKMEWTGKEKDGKWEHVPLTWRRR
jgi:hypothetical protein